MAIATIPQRAMSEQGFSFRNLIINGDMSIAQRGTSVSVSDGSNEGYQTLDRWRTGIGTMSAVATISQSTDVPTGQGFANSFKLDVTTADASLAGGDFWFLQQRLEGQMLQQIKKGTANAEQLTLSFWIKATKTGTNNMELEDKDNSRFTTKQFTIDSANTWEKKILTFDADTTGVLSNDNGDSLDLNIWIGAGSNWTSGSVTSWASEVAANRAPSQTNHFDNTANEWYITGVQLEVGTSASDFEFLPYDVNLQRCQRYYEQNAGYTGFFASNSAHLRTTMKVSKRTQNPSVAYSNSPMTVLIYGGSAEGSNSGSSGTDQRSIDFVSDSHHIRLLNMTGTGASNGNGCILTDQQYVVVDAEL